jgi:hypothetical protein
MNHDLTMTTTVVSTIIDEFRHCASSLRVEHFAERLHELGSLYLRQSALYDGTK